MSLDITLINPTPTMRWPGTGVFVREGGANRELTANEVHERWPNAEIQNELVQTNEVWSCNITHNLNKMADQAGLYEVMWHPEDVGCFRAQDTLIRLTNGFLNLIEDPNKFKELNPDNGWGTYEQLVESVRDYIIVCVTYPDATIEISR